MKEFMKMQICLTIVLLLCVTVGVYAYEVVEVTNGGSISGTITFGGTPPKPEEFKVNKSKYGDKDIAACHLEEGVRTSDALLVGKNKGIKDVIVSLVDIQKGKGVPTGASAMSTDEKGQPIKPPKNAKGARPWMTQRGCQFSPHVIVIPANTGLEVYNEDGIGHNIHAIGFENRGFNNQQPGSKRRLRKAKTEFKFAEVMNVKCDIHNWMSGLIVVASHPYYAITTPDGSFSLKDVPPGAYELQIQHEKLGIQKAKVTVESGKDTTVKLTMKPKY